MGDDRIEAVRDHDMDDRCEHEARWWRCPGCGASYVMERGVRPLFCTMCGAGYWLPDCKEVAGEGDGE